MIKCAITEVSTKQNVNNLYEYTHTHPYIKENMPENERIQSIEK